VELLRQGGIVHEFRAFISTAEEQHTLPVSRLVDHMIQECANVPAKEIYFYRRDGNTTWIDDSIYRSIDLSAKFVIVIDDNYFRSSFCLRELHRFCMKGAKSLDDICVVISQYLLEHHQLLDQSSRFSDCVKPDGIARDELNQEQRSFLDSEWVNILERLIRHRKYVDLREGGSTDAKDQLGKLFADPQAVHITRCARVAAFCLGADRFYDGGWGYSLGEYGELDSGDGDRLPSGPYGMAIVGLRALGKFLPKDEHEQELEAVFRIAEDAGDRSTYERNPLKIVHDNLPDISNYLSHVDIELVSNNSGNANRALSPDFRQARWILPAENKGRLEFRSIAYAASAKSTFVTPTKRRQIESLRVKQRYINEDGDENHVYDPNNLFAPEVRKSFAKALWAAMGAHRNARNLDLDRLREYSLAKRIAADARSLLEAPPIGFSPPDLSDDEDEIKWHIVNFDNSALRGGLIERLVADAIRGNDQARVRISCFLADCASALRLEPDNKTVQINFLDPVAKHVFAHEDREALLSQLDAIAWAAVIDIAFAVYWRDINENAQRDIRENLALFWRKGKDLKTLRTDLIKNSDKGKAKYKGLALSIPEAFALRYKDYLSSLATIWSVGDSISEAIEARADALEKMISNASFRIGSERANGRRHDAEAAKADTKARRICGSLRVCADTGRVEIETPGYHKLFLEPFRDLTGMDVVNLRTISREFGDEDKTLVEIMGRMVVRAAYAAEGDGSLKEENFIERTKYVISVLSSNHDDDGFGMEDLIELNDGNNGTRWVHRTAILQKPRAGKRTIAWRFAQVPSRIAEMCIDQPAARGAPTGTRPGAGAST
jgi:hypothetical protein